jgi:hypothetical protein
VHPSDPNQRNSTWLNLMPGSPRASAREAPRDTPRELAPGARLLWFGPAGLIILGLIGALAWITHENVTTPRALPVAVGTPATVEGDTAVARPAGSARARRRRSAQFSQAQLSAPPAAPASIQNSRQEPVANVGQPPSASGKTTDLRENR